MSVFWYKMTPLHWDTGSTSPNRSLVEGEVARVFFPEQQHPEKIKYFHNEEEVSHPLFKVSSTVAGRREVVTVEFFDDRLIAFDANYVSNGFSMTVSDALRTVEVRFPLQRTPEAARIAYARQYKLKDASAASIEYRVEQQAKKGLQGHLERVLGDVWLVCDDDGWDRFFDELYQPRKKKAIREVREALNYGLTPSIDLGALIVEAKRLLT